MPAFVILSMASRATMAFAYSKSSVTDTFVCPKCFLQWGCFDLNYQTAVHSLPAGRSSPRSRNGLRSSLAAAATDHWNVDPVESMNGRNSTEGGFSGLVNSPWHLESSDEILNFIEGFSDYYPVVRTYRNDLCTLEVCGCGIRSRVLAAMASDQSFTASRNLLRGLRLTVLQTLIPGSCYHSSISTKLFAPTLIVLEKSSKYSLQDGDDTREFVHRFFEAVQMDIFSKFYVEFHVPGTVRDMSSLKQEEKVQIMCTVEASDRTALDEFGGVVTSYVIDCIKKNYGGRTRPDFLSKFWNQNRWVPGSSSPIKLCTLSSEEIKSQVTSLQKSMSPGKIFSVCSRSWHAWWPAPAHVMSCIKAYMDSASDDWINEFVPIHKLQIDLSKVDAKLSGAFTSLGETKEILLTHAQLVDLAGVFDLYYEDRFTLPDKRLKVGTVLDLHSVPGSQMAMFLNPVLLLGILVGTIAFSWLVAARMKKLAGSSFVNAMPTSEVVVTDLKPERILNEKVQEAMLPINDHIDEEEMEALCKSVVNQVLKAFAWSLQVQSSVGKGAWTVSNYSESSSSSSKPIPVETSLDEVHGNIHVSMRKLSGISIEACCFDAHAVHGEMNMQKAAPDGEKGLLTYQIVMSSKGAVVGFQPLNQEAVSLWSTFPFANSLHKGKKCTPGIWERPLKFEAPPEDAVVIELQVRMDQLSPFVSARPFPL